LKIGQLENRADYLFSRIARFSRADKFGMVDCATCGRRMHWTKVDAGHYMSRVFRATRYDLNNVWPQCKPCNSGFGTLKWRPDESIKAKWKEFFDRQIESGYADELWKKAVDGGKKMTRSEAESLIVIFEGMCRKLDVPF
jgi:hypothetical protein